MSEKKLIRDTPLAVAVAKCMIATIAPGTALAENGHPYPCRLCVIPFERKREAHAEWITWSGAIPPKMYDPEIEEELPSPVRDFMRLPPEEQRRLVFEAQGYKEGPDGRPLPSTTQGNEVVGSPSSPRVQRERVGQRDRTGDGTGGGVGGTSPLTPAEG